MYVLNHILAGDDAYYLPVPVTGRAVKVYTCVNYITLDAETTLTLTDGTTTIGVVTIASGAVQGTMDEITIDTTSLGKLEVGPALPIVATLAGGATTPSVAVAIVIDTFHAAI